MAVQGPPGVAGLTGPVGLQGQKVPLDLELFFKKKNKKLLKLKIMMINSRPKLQGSMGDAGPQGPQGPPGVGVAGPPV